MCLYNKSELTQQFEGLTDNHLKCIHICAILLKKDLTGNYRRTIKPPQFGFVSQIFS